MGRHRNDPRGLVNILIIAVGVALALGLVVVGGTALVSSLNSEAAAPDGSPATPSSATTQLTGTAKSENKKVYATIKVTRTVQVFAAGPGNDPVYWQGAWTKGDQREVLWPDVDVTIDDASAVKVQVNGKLLTLPANGKITISFVKGTPEARPVDG